MYSRSIFLSVKNGIERYFRSTCLRNKVITALLTPQAQVLKGSQRQNNVAINSKHHHPPRHTPGI